MAGWRPEAELLREELWQCRDEGCEVPAELETAVLALQTEADQWNVYKARPLWEALAALSRNAALSTAEPNDLGAIRALRPDGPRDLGWQPSGDELLDRIHGAWSGRAAGCALGKPVESGDFGMAVENGRTVGRHRIRAHLESLGEWPLADYFSGRPSCSGTRVTRCPASTREKIAYMEPDDDVHYTLVGLGVLESVGPDFEWYDVAYYWTHRLPYAAICTAETQAILNFWNRSLRHGNRAEPNTWATPEYTRTHKNPYREWIGAQIRADGWAWACAGKPELAAEFAYRDACWTHTRNGIYGEMLFAAMQAAAFAVDNPRDWVEIGLSEIPADCRLARRVRQALTVAAETPDLWTALERVDADDEFLRMSPVHTINNAVYCVLSLLYAEGGVDDAVCKAVAAGLDTDCNGATVGSIVGAAAGAKAGSRLAAKLNDTVKPLVFGFQEVTMTELARRHADVWRKVEKWYRGK